MEEVCPACNGLTKLSATCPFCGEGMTDAGSVDDYSGPYSPYMDEESLNLVNLWTPREFFNAPADSATPDESPANAQPEGLIESEETLPCVHLMACPHCGWDTRVPVSHIFK